MRAVVATLAALAALAAPAHAQSGLKDREYTPCAVVEGASAVQVAGAPCGEAEVLASKVVAVPIADEADVLRAAGWKPLRALTTDGGDAHDLIATREQAALRIRRAGAAPDLDGWEAGRELLFARSRLVGGAPVPKDAVLCSASWLIRLPGGRLGGLSAAHCGGLRSDRTVHRRNVVIRRPPQAGIVLGRVRRILTRTVPYDALVVPVAAGVNRSRTPVVDRGVSRPPWIVAGVAAPTAGRRVCHSGRTSGIDRCGSIRGSEVRGAEFLLSAFAGVIVRCTNIRAREGDSGGPVFTAPRADGTVRAVGITTLVVGARARMCFTPLRPVLSALGASLVTTR